MNKKPAKSRPGSAKAEKRTVVRTFNKNMTLQVIGVIKREPLKTRENSESLLLELIRAFRKPGLRRRAVFTHSGVESFSVSPQNPALYVREEASGRKTIGRLVNGKFLPAPKTKSGDY